MKPNYDAFGVFRTAALPSSRKKVRLSPNASYGGFEVIYDNLWENIGVFQPNFPETREAISDCTRIAIPIGRPYWPAAVAHFRGRTQNGAGRCETCAAAQGPAAELRLAHDHACQLKQLLDSGGGAASQTGSVIIFMRPCVFHDGFHAPLYVS
jgi:hypothetical protein